MASQEYINESPFDLEREEEKFIKEKPVLDLKTFKSNELRIACFLLSKLEKQIYLLRVSLHGTIEEYCPKNSSLVKEIFNVIENGNLEKSHDRIRDFRLMLDCCDIEAILRRIQYEMTQWKSFEVVTAIRDELESESTFFKKHKKMIEAKQNEIKKFKELLKTQDEWNRDADYLKKEVYKENKLATPFDELAFLRKLMEHKQKSQRDCYDHRIKQIQKDTEWYESETRSQAHADVQLVNFWLLKFDNFTEKVDMSLREMFDCWSSKCRNLQILKKYRRLNQEKMAKLQKLTEEKESYIQHHKEQKEIEEKKHKEERKIFNAATLIQAVWKGTMVRKGLGPFKVKASKKKGKGKKGKGKKKK